MFGYRDGHVLTVSRCHRVGAPSPPLAASVLMVIITMMNSKYIIKQLEASGWVLRGVKGSHHIFTHPQNLGHISVPHPKELGVGLNPQALDASRSKIRGAP